MLSCRDDADADYVKEEIGFRLADRLFDIKKEFVNGVDLGGGRGFLTRHILAETIKNLKVYDISPTMLEQVYGTPGVNIEKLLLTKEVLDVSCSLRWFERGFHSEILAPRQQPGSGDIKSRAPLVQRPAGDLQEHQQLPEARRRLSRLAVRWRNALRAEIVAPTGRVGTKRRTRCSPLAVHQNSRHRIASQPCWLHDAYDWYGRDGDRLPEHAWAAPRLESHGRKQRDV